MGTFDVQLIIPSRFSQPLYVDYTLDLPFIILPPGNRTMETEKAVQEIRSLISASDTAEAFQKTRQFLSEKQLEEEMVQLDMIESGWNDIQDQHINGLLSIEDLLRLQNINRAKLMQLLLNLSGERDLAAKLMPKTQTAASTADIPRSHSFNTAFKTGLKNFLGFGMLFSTLGAAIQKDWAGMACFGIAGLVTFLPTLRLLEKTLRFELLSWHKYVIVIGALLTAGALYVPKTPNALNGAPVEQAQ